MLKIFFRSLVFIFFIPLIACTTPPANAAFQAGKDYQVLSAAPITAPGSKIVVMEFYSYGCPWCFHVEPKLETWLAKKPGDIEFERVPVVFEQGWDTLARIYYTTKNLGVSEKLMLPIFKAIQESGQNLTDEDVLKQFFTTQGINAQDFESAYNFSPGIDAQMMRGEKLMKDFGIYAVPAFVINGKYVTTMGMANGDIDRLFKIVNYLIAKERQGVNTVVR